MTEIVPTGNNKYIRKLILERLSCSLLLRTPWAEPWYFSQFSLYFHIYRSDIAGFVFFYPQFPVFGWIHFLKQLIHRFYCLKKQTAAALFFGTAEYYLWYALAKLTQASPILFSQFLQQVANWTHFWMYVCKMPLVFWLGVTEVFISRKTVSDSTDKIQVIHCRSQCGDTVRMTY